MEQHPDTPKSLRVRLGLTQMELAARAGLRSTGPVAALERGDDIRMKHLEAIAAVLGVSVPALLGARDAERALRATGSAA